MKTIFGELVHSVVVYSLDFPTLPSVIPFLLIQFAPLSLSESSSPNSLYLGLFPFAPLRLLEIPLFPERISFPLFTLNPCNAQRREEFVHPSFTAFSGGLFPLFLPNRTLCWTDLLSSVPVQRERATTLKMQSPSSFSSFQSQLPVYPSRSITAQ